MHRDQFYDYHYFCNKALRMLFTQKQHLTHITVIFSEILELLTLDKIHVLGTQHLDGAYWNFTSWIPEGFTNFSTQI